MVDVFKLLSDQSRLRILLMLVRKELCVCQIMGVLGMAQPLVSRNLILLLKAGFLDARREGKMMFYRVKKELPPPLEDLVAIVKNELLDNSLFKDDLQSLKDCTEYQKKTGKCDMQTFLAYIKQRKRTRKS